MKEEVSFQKLSQRQQNILRFMDRYMEDNGFPPTIREIGGATGIDSTSVVNYNLNKLVQAGYLERAESKSRGLRLVKSIPGRPSKVKHAGQTYMIPQYGQIVAGEPINTNTEKDDEVEVPASLLGNANIDDVFALRVKGESMIDAMISDGDIVILRKITEAKNGDMVAVWLDDRNETTLKHFYNEGSRIRLQPAHPTMEAIYVDPRHCHVQGKVLSVMRRL